MFVNEYSCKYVNDWEIFQENNIKIKDLEVKNIISERYSKLIANYFRITGYWPENDCCFIIDSNGMFEKLWQFSSDLIQKGLKVLEVYQKWKMCLISILTKIKKITSIFF